MSPAKKPMSVPKEKLISIVHRSNNKKLLVDAKHPMISRLVRDIHDSSLEHENGYVEGIIDRITHFPESAWDERSRSYPANSAIYARGNGKARLSEIFKEGEWTPTEQHVLMSNVLAHAGIPSKVVSLNVSGAPKKVYVTVGDRLWSINGGKGADIRALKHVLQDIHVPEVNHPKIERSVGTLIVDRSNPIVQDEITRLHDSAYGAKDYARGIFKAAFSGEGELDNLKEKSARNRELFKRRNTVRLSDVLEEGVPTTTEKAVLISEALARSGIPNRLLKGKLQGYGHGTRVFVHLPANDRLFDVSSGKVHAPKKEQRPELRNKISVLDEIHRPPIY